MQARTSLLGKSTGLLGAVVALLCATGASAQVSFSSDFDTGALPGGVTTNFFINNATGPTCSGTGYQLTRNVWTAAVGLISGFAGVSTGVTPVTWAFDYRCNSYASGNTVATTGNWGTIFCEWSNSPSGPWTLAGSVVNEAQTGSCISKSFSFTPTAGAVFFQFRCVWGGAPADEYWNIDNVSIAEPCTGTPNPGNTVGPADACVGGNVVLSLQNAVPGSGISYQWFESTVSATGPWTPVGTSSSSHVTTQAVNTWYYCAVTCGSNTGNSTALSVPMTAGATFPQGWSTGVVDPNCWSTQQIAGVGLPLYNVASGYGTGTGCVQFNFFTQGATVENALVSPTFVAPVPAGQYLVFDAAGAYWAASVDLIYVEESPDNGTTWNTIATLDNAQAGGVLNTSGFVVNTNYTTPAAADWITLGFPLTAGTDRVRLRGDSQFGNNLYFDNLTVSSSAPAYHNTVGVGCYDSIVSSLVEEFPTTAAAKAKLDGNSLVLINSGSGYIALWTAGGGSSYVAPTVGATTLTLTDDGNTTITPVNAATLPGVGVVTTWTVSSNGVLTAGATPNADGTVASRAGVATAAGLAFYSWRDWNPAAAGGKVKWEEIGTTLYVTWDGVYAFGTTDPTTFQFQVDTTTGNVTMVWSNYAPTATNVNVVGATLLGTSVTPPSTDLTTAAPFIMALADIAPMTLSVAGRPVNGGPAPTYTINNIPEYFPGAGFSGLAVVFGFTPIPGGLDLGLVPGIDAPGCFGYQTPDVVVIIGLVPFAPVSFPIAWNIPVAPGQLWMQAVAEFVPGTLPNGQNIGGKVTSNSLEIYIENF